jgi:hypothetical protein
LHWLPLRPPNVALERYQEPKRGAVPSLEYPAAEHFVDIFPSHNAQATFVELWFQPRISMAANPSRF